MASFGPSKIERQYVEDDIAKSDDFNEIENEITLITEKLIELGYTPEEYMPKTWTNKDFLLYTYLNNIEAGLKNIGDSYFRPYGWQNTKTWSVGMSFSYRDVNRWINNINLIIEEIDKNPNITIWNGQSFENWDSYDTGLEWED